MGDNSVRYGSHRRGIVRSHGNHTFLLDLPFGDLSAAFHAGLTRTDLDAAPVRGSLIVDDGELLAPLPRPTTVWAAGGNYRAHREEFGQREVEPVIQFFVKMSTSVSGPRDNIVLPAIAPDYVDYEGEVAIVIESSGKDIAVDDAWNHVFGVTAANDVSARDVQLGRFSEHNRDRIKAKSFDTFTPHGPWIATPDEFADPTDVHIQTFVDGELRQDSSTRYLTHSVAELISFASRFATLNPGDLVLTGTPAGVGITGTGDHGLPWDGARRPAGAPWAPTLTGRFLRTGQVVSVDVAGVGRLQNTVVSA
jgi:2-keto-4-pentenoate hydratase/2-oxohepta-3-ene-1,7-dioic acid hydratase in catechol pathway